MRKSEVMEGRRAQTVGKAVLNCEGLVVNAMGCRGRAPLGPSSWHGVAAELGGWRLWVVERSTEPPGSRGTTTKGPAVDFQGSLGTPETARRKKNLLYSCLQLREFS